ncbi:hypothetical protein CVT25_012800 [Psilocybe cyanescens]|uniref:Uncharacterized protein n=1 Tax=Psilocybe cyanescens TaxID=93625 RepID=A0A409XLF3_PSICY|nr:hypothetical protein CVT25_012800 [Psilocybe cyanescens]
MAADVVVQDTDPSIVYQPQKFWFPSSQSCSTCLNPGGSSSYHEAIHLLDEDDVNSSSSHPPPPSSTPPPPPASSPPPRDPALAAQPTISPAAGAGQTGDPDDNDDDDDEHKQKGKKLPSGGDPGKRRRGLVSRDPDDQEVNITLSFNFTGSAVYLYGIEPRGFIAQAPKSTPTNMNLSFVLDGEPVGDFKHAGSADADGPSGSYANATVFSKTGLEESPHQLVVLVGENSSFLFDYLVYTASATNSTPTDTGGPTPLAQNTPSATTDSSTKKHNIATFAGAVGGSVGILAIFSLGLAISIIRRRRLAAARDRLDSESLHTNGSDDSPHMSGPAPFVPRFFPDTVIPSDPPTYTAALATNANNSTLLSSLTSSPYATTTRSTRSYADIPPSTPPPPLEEAVLIPPPPPFPVAVSSPAPILPPGALPPSLFGVTSRTLDAVGTNRSNSAPPPELVPLLQSAGSIPRPISRASTRSAYDINGNPVDDSDSE